MSAGAFLGAFIICCHWCRWGHLSKREFWKHKSVKAAWRKHWAMRMTNYYINIWKIQNCPKIVFQKMQSRDVFWVQTLGKARQVSPSRDRYCAFWATHLTGTEGCWEMFPFFHYLTAILDNTGRKWKLP